MPPMMTSYLPAMRPGMMPSQAVGSSSASTPIVTWRVWRRRRSLEADPAALLVAHGPRHEGAEGDLDLAALLDRLDQVLLLRGGRRRERAPSRGPQPVPVRRSSSSSSSSLHAPLVIVAQRAVFGVKRCSTIQASSDSESVTARYRPAAVSQSSKAMKLSATALRVSVAEVEHRDHADDRRMLDQIDQDAGERAASSAAPPAAARCRGRCRSA